MNNVNMDIFPEDIQEYLIPKPEGRMKYRCLSCEAEYGIEKLLYICPECKSVLLLHDENQERIKRFQERHGAKSLTTEKCSRFPRLRESTDNMNSSGLSFLLIPFFILVKAILRLSRPTAYSARRRGWAFISRMTARIPAPHSRTGEWQAP